MADLSDPQDMTDYIASHCSRCVNHGGEGYPACWIINAHAEFAEDRKWFFVLDTLITSGDGRCVMFKERSDA